ncbi:hypothetical protein [Commensalibacter nepenthis]|uniref:MADF domain-containing protein n=1 Tax=Commensalibacter nepenthis TaxID=3043872 RepID=A0ABT6QAL5_9PROT|nr:hypothetical protein [Commensalibacter sp. TBRC 10068]MDI2113948.1 hypothetical protein [Commensalibacter sp. TBRC 10068]
MTDKLSDFSIQDDDIEMVKTNPQRSPIYNWLMKHYEIFNNRRNYWKTIAVKFEELGIKNIHNEPYSTSQIKNIWLRVKKAKNKEDALRTVEVGGKTRSYSSSNASLIQSSNAFISSSISDARKEDEYFIS